MILEKLLKYYPLDHVDHQQIQLAYELVTQIVTTINYKIVNREQLESIKKNIPVRSKVTFPDGKHACFPLLLFSSQVLPNLALKIEEGKQAWFH